MTHQEIRIRALTAAKPHYPGWSIAEIEKSSAYLAVLEALNDLDDLDKAMPDPDEAWKPFLLAIGHVTETPLWPGERALIARIKAALPLIPEQYR